jgi:hypothetical protein
MVCLRFQIRTRELTNTKQECQLLNRNIRYLYCFQSILRDGNNLRLIKNFDSCLYKIESIKRFFFQVVFFHDIVDIIKKQGNITFQNPMKSKILSRDR